MVLVTVRTVPGCTAGRGRYSANNQINERMHFRRDSALHKETPPQASPELSNRFFTELLSETWEVYHVPQSDIKLFTSDRKDFYLYKIDLMFK